MHDRVLWHSNLGVFLTLCNGQGQSDAAGPLFMKAFAIREKVLGVEHPAVAQSLYNRAMYVELPKVLLFICICLGGLGLPHGE